MTDLRPAHLQAALGFPLSDEQWAVVSTGLDPAVVVAGAGTGKTTSMAARVAWLVGSGHAAPDQVLGLTFTTKAAAALLAAMRASIAALRREGLVEQRADDIEPEGEPQVLTYHAFAARILAEHGIRLGFEPGARMLSDGARQQLAYRLVCRTDLPLGPVARSPIDVTGSLLLLDDALTELDVTPADLRQFDADLAATLAAKAPMQRIGQTMLATARQRQVLASLVEEWRTEKAARGLLDFADQIRLTGVLLDRYPDIVHDLRDRHRFVLLDEYQDTSIAQRRLLQCAFGSGHSVLAVGDPCQAIYGWRGASVDNIDSFGRHFPPVDRARRTPVLSLSENRRSGPAILQIANRTAGRLRQVHAGARPLVAGDNRKGNGRVVSALFDTMGAELDWLGHQVEGMHGGGVPWRQIAVLCATGQQVAAVDAVLRRRRIPTQVVGSAALLAQPAVIELRAMLEVIHDPTANPAFVRLATGPRWRIDARDLAALGDRAARLAGGRGRSAQAELAAALDDAVAGSDLVDAISLTEALDDLGDPQAYSAAAFERFTEMSDELRAFRRHVGEPLPDLLLRVMRGTGLEVEAALRGPDGQQRAALGSLLDLAAEFNDVDGRVTLGAFLSRLRDVERFEIDLGLDHTGSSDAVQLLTVHKAKGLEFGCVFVPFLSEGAFPGGRARAHWPSSASAVPWPLRDDVTDALGSFPLPGQAPRGIHHDAYLQVLNELTDLETERLAYVAFTRAERALVVSGHWWGPTQARPRGPHPFLTAVHEACLDGLGEVAHWADPPEDGAVNPEGPAARAGLRWPPEPDEQAQAARLEAAAAVTAVRVHQPALPGLSGASADAPADAERSQVAEWDLLADALLEEVRDRRRETRAVRLPDALSATAFARALADPEAFAREIARPMPRRPAPQAVRGTEFHAWIESRFGQQSLLDPEDLPGASEHGIRSDAELADLKAAFERTPFAARAPVAIEAPFAVLVGGRVVSGRIDAVFWDEKESRYDVIDWKTGSADHVDPMQLALYRLAWAGIRGVPVDQVDAGFVMVATGEVIRPDTDPELALLLTSM